MKTGIGGANGKANLTGLDGEDSFLGSVNRVGWEDVSDGEMQSIRKRYRLGSLSSLLSSSSLHLLYTAIFIHLAGGGITRMERDLAVVLKVWVI